LEVSYLPTGKVVLMIVVLLVLHSEQLAIAFGAIFQVLVMKVCFHFAMKESMMSSVLEFLGFLPVVVSASYLTIRYYALVRG
jgi:hypothetical protein